MLVSILRKKKPLNPFFFNLFLISIQGILSALLTFIILCIRMSVDEFVIKKHIWSNSYIKYIISYLIQAVTVIVVAVPEGLPLAVTLSLAYAVRVRNLNKKFLLN